MATEKIMSRSSSSCSDFGSIQEELDNGPTFHEKQKVDNTTSTTTNITKSIRTAILNNKNNNRLDNVNDNNSKNKTKDVALKKKIKTSKKTLGRRDPERFMGEGVSFKGKLIGSQDVPNPRGEKMAQEALQELKVTNFNLVLLLILIFNTWWMTCIFNAKTFDTVVVNCQMITLRD